jgi:hypothetical protein
LQAWQACRIEAKAATKQANNVLQLTEDWAEQGLEQQSMGLWCAVCKKGPLSGEEVVRMHLASQKHVRRLQLKQADQVIVSSTTPHTVDLPSGLVAHGLVEAESEPGSTGKSYRCALCPAGPFTAIEMINMHLRSKKHKSKVAAAAELDRISKDGPTVVADPFAQGRWNLPDYVQEVNGNSLVCTLCNSQAAALLPMRMHLGGDKHARKCRGSGYKELLYVEERQRLEEKTTGRPVVRSGFRMPPDSDTDEEEQEEGEEAREEEVKKKEDNAGREEKTEERGAQVMVSELADGGDTSERNPEEEGGRAPVVRFAKAVTTYIVGEPGGQAAKIGTSAGPIQSKAAKTDKGLLPHGWKECFDLRSKRIYYWNGQVSQWERPTVAAAVAEEDDLPSDAVRSKKCDLNATSLPPGWYAVWDSSSSANYYVDAENQISQWECPPAYVHRDWTRHADPNGRAFWLCSQLNTSFYEASAGQWQRFKDNEGRTYWSNPAASLRFFEEYPDSLERAQAIVSGGA